MIDASSLSPENRHRLSYLSSYLRETRVNSGYTQEQVAREINLSRNSYILSPRNVTLTPMGIPLLSLKFEMSFFDLVATAFCPLIAVISLIPKSMSFLSAMASPNPWLIEIFNSRGTCMGLLYSNCFIRAG